MTTKIRPAPQTEKQSARAAVLDLVTRIEHLYVAHANILDDVNRLDSVAKARDLLSNTADSLDPISEKDRR